MLPPVSLPIANPTNPAAVAAPGPALDPVLNHASGGRGRYGLQVSGPRAVLLPAIARTAPVPAPVRFGPPAASLHRFRPLDQFGSPSAPAVSGDSPAGSPGIAPVQATAYNSMSAMNHMRFECGWI